MYYETTDIAYLDAYFKQCKEKGHAIQEWGGMYYCSKCGGASYIIWLRNKQGDPNKVNQSQENKEPPLK